jgi:hypothetical protein
LGIVMFLMLLAAHSALKLSRTSLHSLFIGAKTATSRGWVRCVEFGGRKMYLKKKQTVN